MIELYLMLFGGLAVMGIFAFLITRDRVKKTR
jgi:hypothetical protein